MLKLSGEEVVTLELVHRPADGPVQVGIGLLSEVSPNSRCACPGEHKQQAV